MGRRPRTIGASQGHLRETRAGVRQSSCGAIRQRQPSQRHGQQVGTAPDQRDHHGLRHAHTRSQARQGQGGPSPPPPTRISFHANGNARAQPRSQGHTRMPACFAAHPHAGRGWESCSACEPHTRTRRLPRGTRAAPHPRRTSSSSSHQDRSRDRSAKHAPVPAPAPAGTAPAPALAPAPWPVAASASRERRPGVDSAHSATSSTSSAAKHGRRKATSSWWWWWGGAQVERQSTRK